VWRGGWVATLFPAVPAVPQASQLTVLTSGGSKDSTRCRSVMDVRAVRIPDLRSRARASRMASPARVAEVPRATAIPLLVVPVGRRHRCRTLLLP